MSWYDGIGGAVVGGLASLGTSFLQAYQGNSSNKKAAKRNYQYYLRSLSEGPVEQREGLIKAGYNPMLALGGVGSSSYAPQGGGVTPSPADIAGSAKMGSMIVNALKEQKARIENVEADTELKEGSLRELDARTAQAEASTALLHSQVERSDLAYGRDIVDTVASIAGTAGSLYSAKAMSDVAKANAAVNARNATVNERRLDSHTTETHYDKKGKATGRTERMTFSHGQPSVDSSAKGSRPSAVPQVGSSAKTAGRIAKGVAENLLFLAPVVTGAYGVGKLQESANRSIKSDKRSNYGKGYKHFVPRLGL